MQEKCLSRPTGTVLAENLQPQAWALGPLFITFYTEQARLSYHCVFICSIRATFRSKDGGVRKREPQRCRFWPSANTSDI